MSRWLLEDVVRRRVRALPGVTVRGRSLVRGPLTSGDSVVGVVLDDGEVLDADLVVDAAGRAGRSVAWLAHLGFEPPPESVIECDVAYASAVLRPSAPEALTGAGVLVLPDPAGASPTRVGYLTPIEGGLWMAGLGGRFGDYPPAEVSGWRDFGRSLAWPGWDELVGTAELVGPPVPYRYPRSVRRHFERLERFPDGLLPLGDAICHVNPLYGQGMSAAAAQVRALDDVLDDRAHHRSGLDGLAREFFPLAFDATRTPWAVSAGADLVSPGTVGDYPDEELGGLLGLVQLGRLIDEDAEAAELLADIFSLRRPLSVLDQPGWRERLAPVAPASPVGVD
jgi:2-polyprenyl-6-methoxyphenol hydroxylase-like FAD-dependent oxidoreductase